MPFPNRMKLSPKDIETMRLALETAGWAYYDMLQSEPRPGVRRRYHATIKRLVRGERWLIRMALDAKSPAK